MSIIQRYTCNKTGRDFAVGDIHGHFTRLQNRLDEIGFNPECDRLFSVGDLADRGPECESVLEWLEKSWFHAVRGNHDDYVVRYQTADIGNWVINGGAWFQKLDAQRQAQFCEAFKNLPLAIEVETAQGLIGIVHADCPVDSWADFEEALLTSKSIRDQAMWSRDRIQSENTTGIAGVRAVICGHTPTRWPIVLGNVYHIDTGGWLPDGNGHFTILELATLQVAK